jgi:hypothetical protein
VRRLILLKEPQSEDWARYVHPLISVKNKSSDLSGTIDLTGQRLGLHVGVAKVQLVSCARLRDHILGVAVYMRTGGRSQDVNGESPPKSAEHKCPPKPVVTHEKEDIQQYI